MGKNKIFINLIFQEQFLLFDLNKKKTNWRICLNTMKLFGNYFWNNFLFSTTNILFSICQERKLFYFLIVKLVFHFFCFWKQKLFIKLVVKKDFIFYFHFLEMSFKNEKFWKQQFCVFIIFLEKVGMIFQKAKK